MCFCRKLEGEGSSRAGSEALQTARALMATILLDKNLERQIGITTALTGFDPTGIIMKGAPRRLRQGSPAARTMLSIRITAMSPEVSFNTSA